MTFTVWQQHQQPRQTPSYEKNENGNTHQKTNILCKSWNL